MCRTSALANPARLLPSLIYTRNAECQLPMTPSSEERCGSKCCQLPRECLWKGSLVKAPAVWAGKLAFCVREGCLLTDAVKWLKLQDQDLEESFAVTRESSKEERPPDMAAQGP